MSDLTPLGLPAHLRSLVKPGQLPDRSKVSCLELDEVVVLGQYLGHFEEWTPTLRLAVGAWLTARRGEVEQGQWADFIAGYAEAVGRAPATVAAWMRTAQKAYELDPPKGANAGRRKPRDARGIPEAEGDSDAPREQLPPDQATAMLQMRDSMLVAPPRYVAGTAKPEIRDAIARWCRRYLAALPCEDPAMVSDEKLVGKSVRGSTTVRPGKVAPTACAHPRASVKRGTSGLLMCQACLTVVKR